MLDLCMLRLDVGMHVRLYVGCMPHPDVRMHVDFACQYACPFECLERGIRFADAILEWGLLDRTRFASKTAQFAKGKLESPSPPSS